jgi:hypothetical protein
MADRDKHVFISYSHHDAQFVNQLSTDLASAGIRIWIDHTGLSPGTPNWEQAIRDAIRDSSAILLVASPSSRVSLAVQGEVSVGRSQGVRVIPLWASGNEWYDCVALDMVSYHYLDFRDARYADALGPLVALLRRDANLPAPPIATHASGELRHQGQILVDLMRRRDQAALPVTHLIGGSN